MSIENKREKVIQAIKNRTIKDDTTFKVFLMIEELKEKIDREIPAIENLLKRVKGEKGDKGESIKGDKGDKGDFIVGKDGSDGKDGKDAEPIDKDRIVVEATELVSKRLEPLIPTIDDITQQLPKSGGAIRNSLELLQGDDRLEPTSIKGLEELMRRTNHVLLGGYGGMNLFVDGVKIGATKTINFAGATYSKENGRHTVTIDSFAENEIPTGTVNGSNTAFTLANTPITNSLKVFVNGQRLKAGGEDYTLSGTTITFVTAPPTTSILLTDYRY